MYAIIVAIFGDKLFYKIRVMFKRLGDYKIGFKYIDIKTNKEIKNIKKLLWIKNLKIPPAYKEVIINTNKDAKVLAYGFDSKGRKQCIYNPVYIKSKSITKFQKITNLNRLIKKIHDDVLKNITNNNDYIKELSIVIYLIFQCGFRIGNKKYEKDNNSYGITTIKCKHLSFGDKCTIIDFIGKKGVRNVGKCYNKYIFSFFQNISNTKSQDDYVFSIKACDVNNYLKKWNENITSKDLRTWNANNMYIKFVKEGIKNGVKNPSLQSLKEVALRLHNTPNVCKKNYIDPEVINFFDNKIKNDTK